MHACMHACIHTYIHTCMHKCMHTYIHIFIHACINASIHTVFICIKPGSFTRRGSNIRRVVQQNEWNKCLGPFKCWVPKLLNIINVKIMPYLHHGKLAYSQYLSWCVHPPFGCWYSRLFTAYLSCSLSSRRMHLRALSVSGVHALL